MHLMTALTGAAVMAMAGVTMGDSLTRLGCDSDITTDGQVDVNDVLDIVGAWGTDAHDTDGDGVCGVNELLQVLQEFGQSCQPFFGNMTVLLDYDQGIALVAGTGLANHPMGPFDGSTGCFNPNTPTAQGDVWQIPLNPVRTNNPGTVLFDTLGPVGVSLATNLDVGDLVVVTSVGEDRIEAGLSWGRHVRRLSRLRPVASNDATPGAST